MNNLQHRLLVVDDDPDIGMMIKMMLEYKGFSVTVVERAEKIDAVLNENNIALIIMDMLLSGMNGTDVCKRLKADPKTSRIPLIMISAHPNAREVCLKAGADEFIAKPFDMNEILTKISMLINKNQTENRANNES